MAVYDVTTNKFLDSHIQVKQFVANLAQTAGTYTLCTVSGGIVDIVAVSLYNDIAATGLTSVTMATNDTTPVTILASTALAALTGGKTLAQFTTALTLPIGKAIQYTIVGTGTAGSIQALVRFIAAGAGSLS